MVSKTSAMIDTTSKIWDWLYKTRIPTLASRHIEDIRAKGTVISGVPAIDKDIRNTWTTTMLSISQMVDYYRENVPVKVVHYDDTKDIYNAISDHIYAWKSRLERGINIGDAPIDDLILLDRFANVVYDHAKYQFTSEIAESIIGRHMSSVQRINSTNFFGKLQLNQNNQDSDGAVTINPIEDKLPERDSLGEFFKTRLMNITRSY